MTNYHAKYLAHEITRRCASDSVEKLTAVLSDAQVDLNPHQIDAALFAFRNPSLFALTSSQRNAIHTSGRRRGIWLSSTKLTVCATSTSRRTRSPTPSSRPSR